MSSTTNSPEDYKKLWLTYLNFTRRKACRTNAWSNEQQTQSIRDKFEEVITCVQNISGYENCYDLFRYYAHVEAKYCKNMANARRIYVDMSNQSPSFKRMASFWLDYANLELMYGDEDEYRKIMYKGLNLCSDYPESISDALLRFEQEDGKTVEQLRVSMAKCEIALTKIQERRAKEAEKLAAGAEEKGAQPKKSLKRKNADSSNSADAEAAKKPKKSSEQNSVPAASQSHGVFVKTDDAKREQTVFISNLNFDLTEDEIREAFIQFGPINEIRLARNFKGNSKGFAYVEFEKIESARKSRLHDRMLVRGRPVFISEMDKRSQFSYSTNKEKNKLFIKNIPFEVTKEDLLDKVFSDYADSVVDVRLVTFRNGHSKGIAYVEMKSAAIAEKAVKDKNDFEIGDRKLFVAISDPSLGKATKSLSSSNNRTGASSSRPATNSMMIPHSLLAKSKLGPKTHPSKVKMQLDEPSKPAATSTSEPSNGQPAAKNLSNDQFRSMFLK